MNIIHVDDKKQWTQNGTLRHTCLDLSYRRWGAIMLDILISIF